VLLIEKFSREPDSCSGNGREPDQRCVRPADVDARSDGEAVLLQVDGEAVRLSREAAVALGDDLERALTERHEFLRTAGERREDGSYVVERRGADSSGHRKVFDSFDALDRLYDRLPTEFTAEAVGRSGLTGGRRHMVVRHFVEHPAFECDLASRQPLTVRKREPGPGDERDADRSGDERDADRSGDEHEPTRPGGQRSDTDGDGETREEVAPGTD
jgi:hypothetical protein